MIYKKLFGLLTILLLTSQFSISQQNCNSLPLPFGNGFTITPYGGVDYTTSPAYTPLPLVHCSPPTHYEFIPTQPFLMQNINGGTACVQYTLSVKDINMNHIRLEMHNFITAGFFSYYRFFYPLDKPGTSEDLQCGVPYIFIWSIQLYNGTGATYNFKDTITFPCNPQPVMITPSPIVCPGQVVNLSVMNAQPGWTYTWTPAGCGGPNTGTSFSVCPTTTTTYGVTASNGTYSCTNYTTVHVSPPETVEIKGYSGNSVCFGDPVRLTAYSPNYPSGTIPHTVQWEDPSGTPITATGPNGAYVDVTQPGVYKAWYNNPMGCGLSNVATFEVMPCCVDDSPPYVHISSGTYTPLTWQYLMPGLKIYIDGDVTFDGFSGASKLSWKGHTIYVKGTYDMSADPMVTGGYINLKNSELYLEDCNVHSLCDVMWGGFKDVSGKSILSIEESWIYDAYQAGWMNQNSSLSSNSSTFENNFQGLVVSELNDNTSDYLIVMNTKFQTAGLIEKHPYQSHLGDAGFVFENIGDAGYTVFNENTYSNLLHGVKILGAGSGGNNGFEYKSESGLFENVYLAGILVDNNSIGHQTKISVSQCTFNFPETAPTTPSLPVWLESKGIQLEQMHDLYVENSIFTSGLSAGTTLPSRVGIYTSTSYKNIYVNNCQFVRTTRGIDISPEGIIEIHPNIQLFHGAEVDITSNFFRENRIGIQFRSNPVTPTGGTGYPMYSAGYQNMNFNVGCNDFIQNTPNPQRTAISVMFGATMVDIGNCSNPSGNEIRGPHAAGMRSIWSNGSAFNYYHYLTETFQNNANFGVGLVSCNSPLNASTCPGNAGAMVLEQTVNEQTHHMSNSELNLYPNPSSSGIFNISVDGFSDRKTVQILHIDGRVLREFIMEQDQSSINLTGFAKGLYLVRVSDGSAEKSTTIVYQ